MFIYGTADVTTRGVYYLLLILSIMPYIYYNNTVCD